MSGLVLLMGLLVLSYAGSLVVSARPGRSLGLASGTELVVLGVVIGPEVLSLVGPDTLGVLGPLAHVALGWVGLILGVSAGSLRALPGARAGLGRGLALAAAAIVAVAAPVFALLAAFPRLAGLREAAVIALGCGVVVAGVLRDPRTTDAGRDEPVARGSGGDLAAVVALVVIAALTARPGAAWLAWIYAAAGPLVGCLLGAIAALLLGREPRDDATWGVLLGVSLLAIGIAARLWLHALAVTFAIGAVLALVSPARALVRALIAPTERAVALPTLVLAGASVIWRPVAPSSGALGARVVIGIVALAVALRLLVRAFPARRAPAGEARATLLGAPPLGVFVGLSILLAEPTLAAEQRPDAPRLLAALPLLVAAVVGLVAEIARARARAAAGSIPPPRAPAIGPEPPASPAPEVAP